MTALASPAVTASGFADHFSAVASTYAAARPDYPEALFDWIGAHAPGTTLAWDAGCGSGQASRGLAARFDRVHATDPSAAQVAAARGPANVSFAVEPAEACSLDDGTADVACVAQALHWFDRPGYFAACARVLRPGGLLVAWGYQDIVVPQALADANARLQAAIAPHWPAERALVDQAYAGFAWPFAPVAVPRVGMHADWTLERLLGYFGSYSATQRSREATGTDPVGAVADAFAAAWGTPGTTHRFEWPVFVHARRKR